MSNVYIGVGQCGNQVLAQYLITCIERNPTRPCVISTDKKCRAILVDTEPKVVSRFQASPQLRKYVHDENIIHGSRGRGSNWSYGYHGCKDEEHLLDKTMEQLRHEVEKCDSLSVFQLFHSLAGGTGSGFGSRLSEEIRDIYGLRFILHTLVSPHGYGESPLQSYNAALCLSHVLESADGILHFYNDHLLQQLSSNAAENDRLSQSSINRFLSQQLADLLTPCPSLYAHSRFSNANQEAFELIRSVCPMPEAKLINCVSADRRSLSTAPTEWSDICKRLCMNSRAAVSSWQCSEDLLRSTLSAVCVARGDASGTFPAHLDSVQRILKKHIRPVSWNTQLPIEFWSDHGGPNVSLTLAFNSASTSAGFLTGLSNRCLVKLSASAYLHWYQRYGTTKLDINDACDKLKDAAERYRWLCSPDVK